MAVLLDFFSTLRTVQPTEFRGALEYLPLETMLPIGNEGV